LFKPEVAATQGTALANWKLVFMEQRQAGTMQIWAEPFTTLRMPKMFNLRTDPYEKADVTSNTYWDWVIDRGYLSFAAMDYIANFLMTLKDYPPRQKADSWNMDEVVKRVMASVGAK